MTESVHGNWGRWGADDERGALNLVTPAKTVEACRLARDGRVFTLGRQIRYGMLMSTDRPAPTYVLTVDGGDYAAGARSFGRAKLSDDFLSFAPGVGTHMDGLAHAWEGDQLYNGHDAGLIRSRGAKVLGIQNVGGVVTRGILLDVAGLIGGPLPPSYVISAEELETCADAAGGITPGDAVLIRTGWLLDPTKSAKELESRSPGIGVAGAQWLADRDAALVGADNFGVEAFPTEDPEAHVPVHLLLLREYGIHLIELLDLEALAESGAREFLFSLSVMPIRGGINSPVNPLAIT